MTRPQMYMPVEEMTEVEVTDDVRGPANYTISRLQRTV